MFSDTTPEAQQAQDEAYRRMSEGQRFMTAIRMSESVRRFARERIRRQNPSFDEKAVTDQLIWELYGIRRSC